MIMAGSAAAALPVLSKHMGQSCAEAQNIPQASAIRASATPVAISHRHRPLSASSSGFVQFIATDPEKMLSRFNLSRPPCSTYTRTMVASSQTLADVAFVGEVIEWRGPAPFFFVAVPPEWVGELRYAARLASYGWGVVPVQATIGGVPFTTSLFPRDGGYLLPLKLAVRAKGKIGLGDMAAVEIRVTVNDGA